MFRQPVQTANVKDGYEWRGEINLRLTVLDRSNLGACAHLFRRVFSAAPWFDRYEYEGQVEDFLSRYLELDTALTAVVMEEEKPVALCVGTLVPWIRGWEYLIDEFCVAPEIQGRGVGGWLLEQAAELVRKRGANALLLSTQREYPAYRFYLQHSFLPINTELLGRELLD